MRIEEENLFSSMSVGAGGTLSLSQISDVSDSINPSSGQVLTWNGNLWVATTPSGGGGGTSNVSVLNDLSDVSVSSATNGQVLTYNGTNWVASNGGGSGGSLSSLSDVSMSVESLYGGELLSYNAFYEDWRPVHLIIDSFIDTDVGGYPGAGKLLYTTTQPSANVYGAYEWGYLDLDSNTLEINNGVLSVIGNSGTGATRLKQLSDVNSNLYPSSGEVLSFDGTEWDSKSLELDDLSFVDTSGAQDNYVLTFNANINGGNGGWEAQAPTGGQSSTYYADGNTLSLSNNTFSVLASPALYINNIAYSLPSVPNNVSNHWYYLSVGVDNGVICLDWTVEYSADSVPTSGHNYAFVSSDGLYDCFGNGVDGTTIEIDSNGKLHAISGTQLSGLSDVDSNLSPSNGQVLTYNNTSHQWEAQTPSGSSSSSITWTEHLQ